VGLLTMLSQLQSLPQALHFALEFSNIALCLHSHDGFFRAPFVSKQSIDPADTPTRPEPSPQHRAQLSSRRQLILDRQIADDELDLSVADMGRIHVSSVLLKRKAFRLKFNPDWKALPIAPCSRAIFE